MNRKKSLNSTNSSTEESKLSVANSSHNKTECSNHEYEAVHANKLTIDNEVEGKPVLVTVNKAEYSCFKTDENLSDVTCLPVKNMDIEGIQAKSCYEDLPSESCLDQSAPSSAETKTLISALNNQERNVSLTSKPIVKPSTVSLKIVDLKGRKKKYRVNMKQSMEKLVVENMYFQELDLSKI